MSVSPAICLVTNDGRSGAEAAATKRGPGMQGESYTDRGAVVAFAVRLLSCRTTPEWPEGVEAPAFLRIAVEEGVVALLHHELRATGRLAELPLSVFEALRDAARRQAAVELVQRAELQRVMAGLHEAGVGALLLKGASLAYTVYPDPACRPRGDTDLLVREGDRDRVDNCLCALGYDPQLEPGGLLSTSQRHYVRVDGCGVRHAYDIHEKLSIPHRFADVLRFKEMEAAATTVPLVAQARGLGRVHALLLACVHRVAHHFHDRDRLIWLYDIHLLAEALSPDEARAVVDLAGRGSVRQICEDGLSRARARFGTRVPDDLLPGLRTERNDASAVFLRDDLRLVDLLRDDFRALPGWGTRLRLLAEHLFPGARYMRQRYPDKVIWPLPALYALRVVRGAPKWLRRLGTTQL
jgi:Uncharacterised nucleotidyltransferase